MEEIKLHQFREKLELAGYSKRVQDDYPAYIQKFFTYLESEEDIHNVKDISLEHVTSYHSYLQYRRLKKGDAYLSIATVHNRLKIVKTFFTIMHREGLVEQGFAPLIMLPRCRKQVPRHVPTEKEMAMLLGSVGVPDVLDVRDRALLELLYATGIRNQEVRDLTVDSLDLTEQTLFVTGKGSKDRVVPVGKWVVPWLLDYLESARPTLLNEKSPVDILFLSKNGRQLSKARLWTIIKERARKAGIVSPISPHSFRHACATHLLKAGADIRYVQELLGHSDLSSTQIYTKLDITFLKKAHAKYHPRERMTHDS
jgi:integrase/recombinase XerD